MRLKMMLTVSALGLSCGSGCVTEPAVKLYGARISHVTPAGVGLTTAVKVINDNSFDIMVRGVRTNVSLAGRYMLPPITTEPQTWLPSGRATVVEVPVVIPWHMVTPLVSTTLGSNNIRYRMVGRADVTATRALELDFDDYKFDQEGAFSRADLLLAAGRGFFSEGPSPAWAHLDPTLSLSDSALALAQPAHPYGEPSGWSPSGVAPAAAWSPAASAAAD